MTCEKAKGICYNAASIPLLYQKRNMKTFLSYNTENLLYVSHNIEVRPSNTFCCGKAIIIKYSVCVTYFH
jgi:hypothetical protein